MWREESPILREVEVAAGADLLFSYFIDPVMVVRWLGVKAMVNPTPGGLLRIHVNEWDVARGTFLSLQPPYRLRFTWGWEGAESPLPPGSSEVEVSLLPTAGGTLLTLRHSGVPVGLQSFHESLWDRCLHVLVRLAESEEQ